MKLRLIILVICLPFFTKAQDTLRHMEYWYDTAFSAKVTVPFTPAKDTNYIDTISVTHLSHGFHTFNSRFMQSNGKYSSVISSYFYRRANGTNVTINSVTAMRYWVDTMVTRMDTIKLSNNSMQGFVLEQLNLSSYDTGDHYLFMQFKDAANNWSSVIVDSFYQLGRPRIDSYTPKVGGNTGFVTMSVIGDGFIKGTTVKLTRVGKPDIVSPDSVTKIIKGTILSGTFDLRQQDTGYYDLVVSIPNDSNMIIKNGFKIEKGNRHNLVTDIIGPPIIRANTWGKYTITVHNPNNVNFYASPIWLTLPAGLNFNMNFDFAKSKDTSINYDTVAIFFPSDSISNKPSGAHNVIPIIIPKISPGETKIYEFSVNSSFTASPNYSDNPYMHPPQPQGSGNYAGSNCEIKIMTGRELYNFDLVVDFLDCVESSFTSVVGVVNPAMGAVTEIGKDASEIVEKPSNFAQIGEKLMKDNNVVQKSTLYPWLKAVGFLSDKINKIPMYFECKEFKDNLLDENDDYKCKPVNVVAAIDPNAKYGPQGSGPGSFVANPTFPYKITYENDKKATAWAQTVRIVDTLDTAIFDKSSFELGFIQLADSIINIPNGKKQHKMYIDMRPHGNNVIVQFDGGINDTTGVAQWLFQTLDPVTMEPTTDPLAGFVPPNVNAPEGEGGVFFTVKLKDGVANNTVVSNKAYIYFDNNAPIPTDPWKNTIDNIKPHSNVNSLPTFIADTVINVSWKGTDTSSGVIYYTVYVSENGKPYDIWRYKVGNTADTFIGKTDSTYAFYSVATDTAGNIEEVPNNYDAITKLVPVSVTSLDKEDGNIALYPNPTEGTFTIEGKIDNDKPLTLTVYNVLGQKILAETVTVNNGNFRRKLNIKPQPSGQYSVALTGEGWNKVYKLNKL